MARRNRYRSRLKRLMNSWLGKTQRRFLAQRDYWVILKQALAERMLNAEMDVHLDSETEQQACNHRNGSSQKTVLSEDGELVLSTLEIVTAVSTRR